LSALEGVPFWTRPDPCPAGLPPIATVGAYDGPARALLIGFKERGALALARPLGAALARSLSLALTLVGRVESVVVLPVPSSAQQCRRRGADVVAELAQCAVRDLRALGVPVRLVRALRQVRAVADSAGLDARARAANTAGALGLRRGAAAMIGGSTVVLVDDVVTTGASLAESARVLHEASAFVVAAATVAATRRHERPPGAGHAGIRSPAAQQLGWGLRC